MTQIINLLILIASWKTNILEKKTYVPLVLTAHCFPEHLGHLALPNNL